MTPKLPGTESSIRGVRLPPVRTVAEWRRAARELFRREGFEAAATEADLIAAHVLDHRRVDLALAGDRELSVTDRRRLSRLLHKRLAHVPLQYLLGKVDFAGVHLNVRPGVFIPRPETEGLVDRVLEQVKPGVATTVLDVGTGSGAIALALAAARPELSVWGTDCSPLAVRTARENTDRLGLGERVRFFVGDLTRPVRGQRPRFPIGAVVSNPPYIARGDRKRLAPEVKDHEPEEALFAESGGMAVIARLVPQASALLPTGGLLALEIGEDLGERVERLLRSSGSWHNVRIEPDLAGKDRYALAVSI